MTNLERSQERFATTRWTQIRALAEGSEEDRREAMGLLFERYWPAVYAYLRSPGSGRGFGRDTAAELTQAFFAEVVLGRGLFDKADPKRGKLRTLLLTALKRFRIDHHRRARVRGADVTIPLEAMQREEAKLARFKAGAATGDGLFDRRWAAAMLEEALRRCEEHFRAAGRTGHWELFEARILRPAASGGEAEPLAEQASQYGFDSPALAAAAVQVVKRRAKALLREVVAETVDENADVEAELAEVRRYLSL